MYTYVYIREVYICVDARYLMNLLGTRCICVHICIYTYVYLYTHMYIYMYIQMYTYIQICTYCQQLTLLVMNEESARYTLYTSAHICVYLHNVK